ncbi:MAG: hypothetical protein ACR2F6_05260 [Mycobacteriales bacterium]
MHGAAVDSIDAAYRAVIDWCAEHSETRTSARWEVYSHADATGAFCTEICWLLR